MSAISIEQSGAFVEAFELPPTAAGSLDGLQFAVKDLIDVAGRPTGCGNPDWLATRSPAAVSAMCVEQLLAAGGSCVGKVITDELAFSLLGQNHFYGTPLNPRAPDRVPGGSSSGSASAVACGLCDFALGTDTGGSVRIPASNCGIWGLRTSHGRVSVAGVNPLAPTFDTVGVLARSIDALTKSIAVLLAEPPANSDRAWSGTVHLVAEALAAADAEVREALAEPLARLRDLPGIAVRETSLGELCQAEEAADLATWLDTYCVLQWAEIDSCLGTWVSTARPRLGPATAASFELVRRLDRLRIGPAAERRERYARGLAATLARGDLLCFPTSPTIAPLKAAKLDRGSDYYRRTLSLTSIAGVGRLPQVSMPLGSTSQAPLGLSLLAAHGADLRLLAMARRLAESVGVA